MGYYDCAYWLTSPPPEAELLEEEAEMTPGGGDSIKISALRRRRRTYSRSLPEHLKQSKQYTMDAEHRGESLSSQIDTHAHTYTLIQAQIHIYTHVHTDTTTVPCTAGFSPELSLFFF